MSDARPAHGPVGVGALSGLADLPPGAREQALAEFWASRAGELAREARRVVRACLVAPDDRSAALDAVTRTQQALLRDVAAGRRSIDPRSWVATVRAESALAVRRSAAEGTVAVAPYRQRLAAQRAHLLAVRETAAVAVPPAVSPRTAVVAVGSTTVAPSLVPVGRVAHRPTGRAGTPRHARRQAGTVLGHGMSPRRSLRWSAAALLSTVTIVVGAAVAPAEERPAGETGTSNVSFVDRLTMPIVGLWDNLVGNGRDKDPDAVVPVPVVSPTAPAPVVQEVPAPTVPQPPVAPAVPVPGPGSGIGTGSGTGGSRAPQEGGRHDGGSGWRDHDELGRGEWHERDDEDDDDRDDDERHGDRQGRGEEHGQGRGDDDRGNGHRHERSDRSRGRRRGVSERRHGRASSVPRV
ncbi:hypothetical protein ACFVQ3_09145 [Oerskovia sp. NPDC057915]|uniref:hypothetical protein n=1 Tax=Oerskovia sp. NPDC057915 TaxID=3346280 RepID=UPI0036D7AD86